ncbi:uncharacterized protein [Dermacentor albipictus]|uniref:uncharacterized protein n=1 Tax=Dermacentor albipictus TaxID=60249 RepID=UPI0038FD1AB0
MNEKASAGSTQFAAQLGHMEPFDVSTNDWASYEERLTSFLIVNRIPEGDRVHAFLSIIGPSTYSLLKSLVAPELPSAKSFEVLKKTLGDHLSPKPSVIGERAKFHRRPQVEGESISDYIAELRKLARTCDFGSALDESLRDRFVCGLLREDIQRVLFTEDSKLTFQRAVERAVAMEAATKSTAEARAGVSTANLMHKVQATSSVQSQACFRCGSPKHSGKACPHVNDKCYKCNKKGHLQRVCRSTSSTSRGKRPFKDTVKTLSVVSRSEVVSVKGVSAPSIEPIMVPMKVNDVTVHMELDTGAAVTVMPFKQYRQFLSSARLNPTEVKLRTYTGALVIPKGVLQVKVQHGGNTASLPLYGVDQEGPPLLGREWLQAIRLEWSKIWNVHQLPRCNELTVHQGCVMLGARVVVPAKLQGFVLDELHDGHPGIVRSKELARSYVWWPTLEADLELRIRSCASCQEQRNAPINAPLHPWSWPTSPWQRVHVDFAGPFQNTMLLVVVDAHSKWPEVFEMRSTTTESTIRCLTELFARFGYPETIVSDNGPQFVSQEFKHFVQAMGARHVLTAPYHPSSNGLAERFIQTLKNALRKDGTGGTLQVKLHKFLLSYRNTPHATTRESPAALLLGRRLRSRLDAVKPSVGERVAHRQCTQALSRPCRERHFLVGDSVLARNYSGKPQWTPAVIVAQTGPVSFQVRATTPRGTFTWRRHQDQLLQRPAEDVTPRHGTAGEVTTSEFLFYPETAGAPVPSSPQPPMVTPVAQQATPAPAEARRYPMRDRRPPDRFQAGL